METPDYLRDLTDSIELIKMLEQLTNGIARGGNTQAEVPWVGIQLTLTQTRERLSRSLAELCSDAVRESYKGEAMSSGITTPSSYTAAQTQRTATLSERIQQAPSGQNRVRELLTNVTAGSNRRNPSSSEEELVGNDSNR